LKKTKFGEDLKKYLQEHKTESAEAKTDFLKFVNEKIVAMGERLRKGRKVIDPTSITIESKP